jgi:hypothetical protein
MIFPFLETLKNDTLSNHYSKDRGHDLLSIVVFNVVV